MSQDVLTRPAPATVAAAASLAFAGSTSMIALPASRCQPLDLCGPEDAVIDVETGIAYVSSQARPLGFGVRQYAQPGAIYSLDLRAATPAPVNQTLSLPKGGFDPAEFHPHRIDLLIDEQGRARVFAISHPQTGSRVEVFDVADRSTGALAHVRSIGPDPAITNPNDIAAVDRNEFYLTNSHDTEKPFLVFLEEALHLPTGSVAHGRFDDQGPVVLKIVEKGFSFLSGIAVDRRADPKRVYVAPLWAEKVIIYERGLAGELNPTGREIPIPGGADNLNFDAFGSLWIGAAPDLGAVVSYGLGHRNTAPSLVLRIPDPTADEPAVQRVFTDDGRLISAASAAAYDEREGQRQLLVGAPFQDRMLIIDLA